MMRGHKIFDAEIEGVAVLLTLTFCKFGNPPSEENASPLAYASGLHLLGGD